MKREAHFTWRLLKEDLYQEILVFPSGVERPQNRFAYVKGVKLLVTPEGEKAFKTTVSEFLRDNKDDEWVRDEVLKLKPGKSVQLGGGAQPWFVVKKMRSH